MTPVDQVVLSDSGIFSEGEYVRYGFPAKMIENTLQACPYSALSDQSIKTSLPIWGSTIEFLGITRYHIGQLVTSSKERHYSTTAVCRDRVVLSV